MLSPVLLAGFICFFQHQHFLNLHKPQSSNSRHQNRQKQKDNWSAFIRLTLVVIGRSIIFYSMITYIPLYWMDRFNQSEASGGMALSILTVSGVVGSVWGGKLSDRFGYLKIILVGFLLLVPCLPVLFLVESIPMATALLIPIGILLSLTYAPTVVLGQQFLPNHIGLSSGVTLGIAVAVGGVAAPIVGNLADDYGIQTAMIGMALLPIPVVCMAWNITSSLD